jgi:antitoxin component of RelBE/YafQ-DinJ toxin-antitoxin module
MMDHKMNLEKKAKETGLTLKIAVDTKREIIKIAKKYNLSNSEVVRQFICYGISMEKR